MAHAMGCKVGLATMSHCAQVEYVLQVLEMYEYFDFVATRDDVVLGKPDPEIYLLVARELGVTPAECLVIEDSPTGVTAAQAAGMACRDAFGPNAIPEAYERLLLDALQGDASLFTRSDGIENSWRVIEPFLQGWSTPQAPALAFYAPGSWGPAAADALLAADGRRWLRGRVHEQEDFVTI